MPTLTVIKLPTNKARVAQLRRKCAEYTRRVLDTTSSPRKMFDAICKEALLEEVLINGCAVTTEVEQKLRKYHGDNFKPESFENACAVISDYCQTGGENVFGGSLRQE